jgi:hypothetical protein
MGNFSIADSISFRVRQQRLADFVAQRRASRFAQRRNCAGHWGRREMS